MRQQHLAKVHLENFEGSANLACEVSEAINKGVHQRTSTNDHRLRRLRSVRIDRRLDASFLLDCELDGAKLEAQDLLVSLVDHLVKLKTVTAAQQQGGEAARRRRGKTGRAVASRPAHPWRWRAWP